jgi:hypothetical protein
MNTDDKIRISTMVMLLMGSVDANRDGLLSMIKARANTRSQATISKENKEKSNWFTEAKELIAKIPFNVDEARKHLENAPQGVETDEIYKNLTAQVVMNLVQQGWWCLFSDDQKKITMTMNGLVSTFTFTMTDDEWGGFKLEMHINQLKALCQEYGQEYEYDSKTTDLQIALMEEEAFDLLKDQYAYSMSDMDLQKRILGLLGSFHTEAVRKFVALHKNFWKDLTQEEKNMFEDENEWIEKRWKF